MYSRPVLKIKKNVDLVEELGLFALTIVKLYGDKNQQLVQLMLRLIF